MRKIVANKSLYDVYFGAGQSAGKYEAQKQEVGDVWSDIDYSKQLTAQKGAQRERTLDTILAATELVSTVGQGMEAKKEWEGHLGRVEGELGEGQRVGRSGKAWEDTSFMEKLFSGKQYKFGSGESARVMGKSDITVAGSTLQYGGKVSWDRFKPPSAAAEAGLSDQASGKSVFAAGKEKLSSILSPSDELKTRARDLKERFDVSREMGISMRDVKEDIAYSQTAEGDIWSIEEPEAPKVKTPEIVQASDKDDQNILNKGDLGSEAGKAGKKSKVDASIFKMANQKDY